MVQKICQIASLLSLLLSASMVSGGYFAYRYFSSEGFKAKVMNEIMENVQGLMPKMLDNTIPDMTGNTIPEYVPNNEWKLMK